MKIVCLLVMLIASSAIVLAHGFYVYSGLGLGIDRNTLTDDSQEFSNTANLAVLGDGFDPDLGDDDDGYDDEFIEDLIFLFGDESGDFRTSIDFKIGYDFEDSPWAPYISFLIVNLNPNARSINTIGISEDHDVSLIGLTTGLGYDVMPENQPLQVRIELGGLIGNYSVDDFGATVGGSWHTNYLGAHINPSVGYHFDELGLGLYLQNNIVLPIYDINSGGDESYRASLSDRIVYMPNIGIKANFSSWINW